MRKRLLFVDDDVNVRRVAELSLDATWDVVLAGSADDALARATPLPDVVLLDVMMPGVDGPATLARLRALPGAEQVPVIFLTAKVLPRDVERLLALGAVGVIAKPFDPMKLSAEVERLLGSVRAPDEAR